jgi:hypothetical protein
VLAGRLEPGFRDEAIGAAFLQSFDTLLHDGAVQNDFCAARACAFIFACS